MLIRFMDSHFHAWYHLLWKQWEVSTASSFDSKSREKKKSNIKNAIFKNRIAANIKTQIHI